MWVIFKRFSFDVAIVANRPTEVIQHLTSSLGGQGFLGLNQAGAAAHDMEIYAAKKFFFVDYSYSVVVPATKIRGLILIQTSSACV